MAGDPYYALDCREDDYAWCNSSPQGDLIPAVQFERLREGLDDYRRLLTLKRLAESRAGTLPAETAEKLIRRILDGFKLGQRERTGLESYPALRRELDGAINNLR